MSKENKTAVVFNRQPEHAILSDRNPYIIELYKRIQDKTITSDSVRVFLEEHGKKLAEYGKEYYHYIRDEFNKNKDVMYFLFLNRSCFNGLIRFNKKGEFNVSFANRPQRFSEAYITKICNQIDDIARIMEGKDWVFRCCDWRETIKQAQEGDVVYLDPPYIDRTTTYFAEWTEKDDKDLVEFAHQTEADVYLSMWKESNLKKNEWLLKNWSDFKWIKHEHKYILGGNLKKEQESNNTDEVFKKRYIQVHPNYYKENVHSLEIIEAVKYTGSESNLTEVYKFCPHLKEIDGLILCHDPRGLHVLFSGYFLTKDKDNHFAVFPSEKFKRLFIEYLL